MVFFITLGIKAKENAHWQKGDSTKGDRKGLKVASWNNGIAS